MLGRLVICLLTLAATLGTQPYINYRDVVNTASFAPQGLPNGSIVRGSIFTIFGRDLGPESFVTPSELPLDTSLGGVSVTVTQGGTEIQAIPIFSCNSQVSAVMPSNAPLGQVIVRLSYEGEPSKFSASSVRSAWRSTDSTSSRIPTTGLVRLLP